MSSIYLIKIFNLIGLILVPLNYIFGFIGFSGINGFIYIWSCLMGFVVSYLHNKKSKLIVIAAIVSYLPAVTSKSINDLLYMIIFFSLIILLIIRTLGTVSYIVELDVFRRGLILCIGTFVLSIILDDIGNFAAFSGYFVIIYLTTSILLLRNLRLAEFTKNSREARKINSRYSIIIVLLTFILSSEYVRVVLVKTIKNAYDHIMKLFFYLFSWLFTGIYYVIANALNRLLSKVEMKEPKLQASGEGDILFSNNGRSLAEQLQNNEILKVIVNVLVILFAAYIIMRFFKKYTNRNIKKEEYFEEKEFVLNHREARKKLKDRILSLIKPKSSEEKIRQYYLRYMSRCQDKHIELRETDTTEDIRNKSRGRFDEALIVSIRNIYIKIRYGEEKASREEVRDMAGYLENIKKQ